MVTFSPFLKISCCIQASIVASAAEINSLLRHVLRGFVQKSSPCFPPFLSRILITQMLYPWSDSLISLILSPFSFCCSFSCSSPLVFWAPSSTLSYTLTTEFFLFFFSSLILLNCLLLISGSYFLLSNCSFLKSLSVLVS